MEYLNKLEQMFDNGHRLVSLETYEVERVSDLLLELSRFSTRPYYMCQPGQPMFRLGAAHISIPRTQTASGLIEHIEATKHYGIFVLREFNTVFEDPALVSKLVNIATGDTHKIVMFLGEFIDLPKSLKPYTLRSKHQMRETG